MKVTSVSLERIVTIILNCSKHESRRLILSGKVLVNGKKKTDVFYRLFDDNYVISIEGARSFFTIENGVPKLMKEN